ncbi:inositol-pentakisphosphate 2-kinase [Umbelopsis sp. PMI_123]|nr:inositol-pentakisphosphate 2-kinase [Umbelopsis sp. PMI_123]
MSVWNPSEWQYRGEGNKHLVLFYNGCSIELKGKVIRLQKVRSDTSTNSDESSQDAERFIETSERVFGPLLGVGYTQNMIAVELPNEFLVEAALLTRRKKNFDRLSTFGQLCDDLLSGPVAVEIKPKWGFMPQIEGQKQKTCRFCMHSHLRGSHSRYCPLDLYSGDRNRVKKALRELVTTPRNNFRVCMNEPFTAEALQTLLAEIIITDPILPHLANLQKSLDELDVEQIWPMYEKHKDQLQGLTLSDWVRAVDNFKSKTSRNDPVQRIMEYTLSMTFKDCSVMISIGTSADKQIEWFFEDRWYSTTYSVKVVDLDLKQIDNIDHWYQLDQTIVQHSIKSGFNHECQSV